MRIDCPLCGLRDNGEFAYLGDASPVRPQGSDVSPEAMIDYVYLRANIAGPHRELWYHTMGCRAWLVITRDTRTHRIDDVALARDVALGRRASA